MVIAKVGVAATIPSLSYPKIGPKIYRQNQLTLVAHLKKKYCRFVDGIYIVQMYPITSELKQEVNL